MKPPITAFTALYTEWLDTFRGMIPGAHKPPAGEPTAKEAQVVANQEWEDEGGSIKPETSTDPAPGSKVPL